MPADDFVAAGPERALLRKIVDGVSTLLAYWDSTLHCRFANQAYARWFGTSPASLVGKHASDVLGPVFELNLPYFEAVLRGQRQEFEREFPAATTGGPTRQTVVTYIPDVVEKGVDGFLVNVVDISERKRAESALRESEAKFSGIISIADDAIISVDEDQRITIFNDGAERIFGYERGEIVGAPLDLLFPARLRAQHRRHVEGFSMGKSSARQMGERQVTIVGVRKTGEEFPAEAAISKLEVGGRRFLTVALRDITERKRFEIEQELFAEAGAVMASSLNRKQTLKAIAQLVVSRLTDLCAVDIVEEGEPMRLTVTAADPAKASVCERLSTLPLDRRRVLSWIAIDTKRPQLLSVITQEQLEVAVQDPVVLELVAELAPRSAIVAPMFAANRVFGALVLASTRPGRFSVRDVPFLTELARRAALAIENARLHEAEQRATKARDEVLAIVAHDVRNPLSSIGFAASALKGPVGVFGSERDSKNIDVIFRSLDRANRLIQDLLDTTRIDAGALSVDGKAIGVGQVLTDAVEAERELASLASLDLRLEADEEFPPILADRARLLQVFENLVGNAIKFTPNGGNITIGAMPRPKEVLFWVADSGTGIGPENLPRVFDWFWKATREERGGAGLGLPICKGIVEAHGGRIWVESVAGRGTTFYFTIPSATQPSDRAISVGDESED